MTWQRKNSLNLKVGYYSSPNSASSGQSASQFLSNKCKKLKNKFDLYKSLNSICFSVLSNKCKIEIKLKINCIILIKWKLNLFFFLFVFLFSYFFKFFIPNWRNLKTAKGVRQSWNGMQGFQLWFSCGNEKWEK
jgi:hypothetical protein